MFDLKNFFSKYASLGLTDKRSKDAFIASVQEIIGVTITSAQIRVRDKEVSLTVPSAIRFAILEHKKEILDTMHRRIGEKQVYRSLR